MWKCAFCGAMNEEENLVCDGCGDERPMTSQSGPRLDKRQDFEDMSRTTLDPSAHGDDEEDNKIEEKDDSDEEALESKDDDKSNGALQAEDLDDKIGDDSTGDSDFSSDALKTPPQLSPDDTTSEPESLAPQDAYSPSASTSMDSSGQRYYLVFINTPAQSLIKSRVAIEFDDFPIVSIGRNPENVVVIPDQEVSRKHAQLSVDSGKLLLKDLNSANGTYLYDGKQFQRVNGSVEVKPNSVLKFGSGTIVRLENG